MAEVGGSSPPAPTSKINYLDNNGHTLSRLYGFSTVMCFSGEHPNGTCEMQRMRRNLDHNRLNQLALENAREMQEE